MVRTVRCTYTELPLADGDIPSLLSGVRCSVRQCSAVCEGTGEGVDEEGVKTGSIQ